MPESDAVTITTTPSPEDGREQASHTGAYASVTADGITVDSNSQTEAELREALAEPAAEPKVEPAERNEDGTFKPKAVGKPRDDPRARMLDATAKEAAAKRERDEARAENTRLKAELEASRAPVPSRTPSLPDVPSRTQETTPATPEDGPTAAEIARYKALPGYPKEGQYDDYGDLVLAQQIFMRRQFHKEEAEDKDRQQAEQASRTRETTWQTKLTDARKEPDFEARLAAVQPTLEQVQISAPMRHVITESPVGPELFLYLCEHPDDAQRLSTLHPGLVLRELGKLEAKFELRSEAASSRGPAPVVPAVSQAKPPIKPLGSSPHVSHDEPGDDASDDEWYRYQSRASRRK